MTEDKITRGAIIIEGHVQGLSLARTLGETGIPVYVVDTVNCIARYSVYTKRFFICPPFHEDSFADFLLTLAKNDQVSGWTLFPSNDHAVITLSRNYLRLKEDFRMLVPPFESIENIYDKFNLLNIASEIGIPTPVTFSFKDFNKVEDTLKYPVITRGRHGLTFARKMKRKAFIANDRNELRRQLEKISIRYNLDDTFSQSVIETGAEDNTISFTAFSVQGEIKTYWMGSKLREHPVKFGTATFAMSVHVPELVELSGKLISYFNYTGVCEIEFLKDKADNKYKLIEINARTWLWVGLAKACGVDYGLYIYNYLNGIDTKYPEEYENGVKWINCLTDTIYSIVAIGCRQLSMSKYIKSLKGKKVHALYLSGDIKPVFAYILLLFTFLRRR